MTEIRKLSGNCLQRSQRKQANGPLKRTQLRHFHIGFTFQPQKLLPAFKLSVNHTVGKGYQSISTDLGCLSIYNKAKEETLMPCTLGLFSHLSGCFLATVVLSVMSVSLSQHQRTQLASKFPVTWSISANVLFFSNHNLEKKKELTINAIRKVHNACDTGLKSTLVNILSLFIHVLCKFWVICVSTTIFFILRRTCGTVSS